MILDYIYRCVDVPRFSFIYFSHTVSTMKLSENEISHTFEIVLRHTQTIFITKTQTKKRIYFLWVYI